MKLCCFLSENVSKNKIVLFRLRSNYIIYCLFTGICGFFFIGVAKSYTYIHNFRFVPTSMCKSKLHLFT